MIWLDRNMPGRPAGETTGLELAKALGSAEEPKTLAQMRATPATEVLTDAMSSYWVNFATTGYPNGAGLPEWPAYDSGTEAFTEFGDLVHQGDHLLEMESDFFEHFNAVVRAKN